jgi:transcriptional regulator with XRE-family HTH domain
MLTVGSETGVVQLVRLKLLRIRKALTQTELAEQAGVSRQTIVRLESGLQEPYPPTIRKIAAALGVEPAELMGPIEEGE